MCLYSHRLVLDILGMHVDAIVHPLQAESAAGHDDSTARKETNSASRAQHIEDRIRVPAILEVALLDPEPVGYSNATADAQSRQNGNSVRWREEEEIQDQGYRRRSVERKVRPEWNPGSPVWENESLINLFCQLDVEKFTQVLEHTPLRPQYKILIRTSIGALVTDRIFLTLKSRVDMVISARSPITKVKVARLKPRIVKCWKCRP